MILGKILAIYDRYNVNDLWVLNLFLNMEITYKHE